ncbi:thiol-disulfide oxidoreductase DCC family protein [Tuberibacillus calidus]|uniref:thiol-disulfide oxidoreductase DCC family protein n=1 Tax=Tuberibacillus calidus TaxID=340097 RepID=UPI00056F548E|nr:DUF393 domain-containing protein [Tuberibacillus calidus]
MVVSRIEVYYDGWCPVCTSIMKKINKLDWFNLIQMQSFREDTHLQGIEISKSNLEKRIHVRNMKTEKIYSGIDAFAVMLIRIPVLCLLWFPLKFLSIVGLGNYIYDFIAKRRIVIPVGHCNVDCQIDKDTRQQKH